MTANTKALKLQNFLQKTLATFPWEISVRDWTDREYSMGNLKMHWSNLPLHIHIKSEQAGDDLLNLKPLNFLDRFLLGDVDMSGNLYLLSDIRNHANLLLSPWQMLTQLISNSGLLFQNKSRAKINVKSHYDMSQEVFNAYLDKIYRSYSCGIFDQPRNLKIEDMTRIGAGEPDEYDSLEKSQWRKFKDAVDFIHPVEGDTLLDIGCGYGGQLKVALENYPFSKVVGWTLSKNQTIEGRKSLSNLDKNFWELNEGDYRDENRKFNHIISIGMVSHVGPRGLIPYVKNVRKRIKKNGRYIHHALMRPYIAHPFDLEVGVAFNKRYVWPGFHWFTLNEHVKVLEENGFEIIKTSNLSNHYAKTTACWYERMMKNKSTVIKNFGEQTFRAWQIYLATSSSGFLNGKLLVNRIYCCAK